MTFFVERPTTFDCATCNRTLHVRCRFTHSSSRSHLSNINKPRVNRAYRRQARREAVRPSAYAFNSQQANDDALEAYYKQCAIEDGTSESIIKEYGQ